MLWVAVRECFTQESCAVSQRQRLQVHHTPFSPGQANLFAPNLPIDVQGLRGRRQHQAKVKQARRKGTCTFTSSNSKKPRSVLVTLERTKEDAKLSLKFIEQTLACFRLQTAKRKLAPSASPKNRFSESQGPRVKGEATFSDAST